MTEVTEKTAGERDDFEMMEKICIGESLQRHADSRQDCTRQATSASGFTLVEMMITVFIMSVLVSFAFPAMKEAVRSYQLTSKANNVANILNHARSEAAKRGLRVTICSSTDGASCAGANQNNWHQGWIMFVDNDNNATVSGTDVIVQSAPANAEFTIVLNGTSNYLSFVSLGMPKTTGFSWWSGTIAVRRAQDSGADPGRSVIVNLAGSIRVSTI